MITKALSHTKISLALIALPGAPGLAFEGFPWARLVFFVGGVTILIQSIVLRNSQFSTLSSFGAITCTIAWAYFVLNVCHHLAPGPRDPEDWMIAAYLYPAWVVLIVPITFLTIRPRLVSLLYSIPGIGVVFAVALLALFVTLHIAGMFSRRPTSSKLFSIPILHVAYHKR